MSGISTCLKDGTYIQQRKFIVYDMEQVKQRPKILVYHRLTDYIKKKNMYDQQFIERIRNLKYNDEVTFFDLIVKRIEWLNAIRMFYVNYGQWNHTISSAHIGKRKYGKPRFDSMALAGRKKLYASKKMVKK